MKRAIGTIASVCLCLGFVSIAAPSGAAGASSLPPITVPLSGLHPEAAPNPRVEIFGVSCAVAGSCVSVGNYDAVGGAQLGLIETLSGGKWSAETAPLPKAAADPGVELNGISCSTSTSCVAVGEFQDASGSEQGVIETLRDGTWSATLMPVPVGAGTNPGVYLWEVDCPTTGVCTAVGSYVDAQGTEVLSATLGSGTWTPSTVSLEDFSPLPNAVHYQWLEDLSCAQPGSCVAAGEYEDVNGAFQLFTDTLSGSVWHTSPLPLTGLDPASVSDFAADGVLPLDNSISCPQVGWCVLVGEYRGTDTGTRGFISTLSGGRWTSETAPLAGLDPASRTEPAAQLLGVSCPQEGHCLAVGTYADGRGTPRNLIETLSGSTWTPTAGSLGALTAGAGANAGSFLFAASCPPTGPCLAGGSYRDAAGHTMGLLQSISNPAPGYWEVASDGGIFSFGSAHFDGSMGGRTLNKPIVGMAATPDGGGYWEVASDGGIFSFGSAHFHGSMGGRTLNKPIVGMAATPDGGGYWEVASDGGIFSFGDARFHGSMGGRTLNKPIVGMAATPDGGGYWEVASDGGIFSFGDAHFHGSMGGRTLNKPIVGMAATPDGGGYWEVASDGGIFTFGDARFHGSMGATPLNKPIVGMAATPDGGGYWEVASDGGIFAFGDATFAGSLGGMPLNKPVVGITTAG